MSEWIGGRNPIFETLRAERRIPYRLWIAEGVQEKGRLEEIRKMCSDRHVSVERVPKQKLLAVADNSQGIALETSGYPYRGLQDILEQAEKQNEPIFLLILDALQDPQNLGTLLRTAEAVGVHGVLLPLRQTVAITPAVVGASSGASEHLQIAQINLAQAIREIKKAGAWVVGLEGGEHAQQIFSTRLDGPIALVVGSEGQGMRSLVRDSCDILVRIPMRGKIESLNAAVAGSIALYLVWRAREKG